jgi:hypothetical protein
MTQKIPHFGLLAVTMQYDYVLQTIGLNLPHHFRHGSTVASNVENDVGPLELHQTSRNFDDVHHSFIRFCSPRENNSKRSPLMDSIRNSGEMIPPIGRTKTERQVRDQTL